MPLLIAVSGFKDSGKTTLAGALLKMLAERGLAVGFVKHCGEDVLSPPESDTGKMEALGARTVFWGRNGARVEFPFLKMDRNSIQALFAGDDIVLVEGGKDLPLPRIWVGDPRGLPAEVKGVFACYDRTSSAGDGSFLFSSGEESFLAEKILGYFHRAEGSSGAEVYVRGRKVPLKPFLARMLSGCLSGLLLPLKGMLSLREGVEIHLKRRQ